MENLLIKSNLSILNIFSLFVSPAKVTSRLVAHLACKVYYDCTSRIPAAVRQWFISLERHFQQVVDPFTATYVSPLLIAQEMAAVSNSFMKFDNMTVSRDCPDTI